jgi:cytochrome c oxidase subunit 2
VGIFGDTLPEASPMAHRVDVLFYCLVGLSAIVVVGIVYLIVLFCVRYRATNKQADRSKPVTRNLAIEFVWILTPLTIFLGIFGWGATLYAELFSPPSDALEVFVVGKQWMWELQHPEGRRELNELHVPAGQPIKLILTSEDVIHSFFVPALRIKRDAVPGRYTSIWFTPTETGQFHLFCAEFCGTDHSKMTGTVTVMEPAAYARWLGRAAVSGSMVTQGQQLFTDRGCSGCHGSNATIHAPNLEGLFGSVVHLQNGNSVIANESYIRDSILLPVKDIVAGFAPIMPSFQDQLSEQQVLELIEYIKSIGGTGEAQ